MDTIVTITVVSESKKEAIKGIDEALSEIRRIEGLVNFFSSDSEISEINRNAGIEPVKVSHDTLNVIESAIDVAKKTDGAFDPTVGVITHLYDFHEGILPDDSTIQGKLPLVGHRNIVVDRAEGTVYLMEREMMMDLGGIAKGYAADRAIDVLRSGGRKAALVAVAGDIRGYGLKPDGRPWRVGIRNPRGKADDVMATIELENMAVSTSGDYERFIVTGGVRYHHIIDPKTGYPARGVMSVSVIAPLAVLTDSFSTAFFIRGIEESISEAQKLGYDALMIDESGKVHMTEPLRRKIEFIQKDN
jgi:thiamine biosynthesis lipoprotein